MPAQAAWRSLLASQLHTAWHASGLLKLSSTHAAPALRRVT